MLSVFLRESKEEEEKKNDNESLLETVCWLQCELNDLEDYQSKLNSLHESLTDPKSKQTMLETFFLSSLEFIRQNTPASIPWNTEIRHFKIEKSLFARLHDESFSTSEDFEKSIKLSQRCDETFSYRQNFLHFFSLLGQKTQHLSVFACRVKSSNIHIDFGELCSRAVLFEHYYLLSIVIPQFFISIFPLPILTPTQISAHISRTLRSPRVIINIFIYLFNWIGIYAKCYITNYHDEYSVRVGVALVEQLLG